MNIYKTVFNTELQGENYLLNIGVLIDVAGETFFSENTASVVNIGKIVEVPAIYDEDGNILTQAVFYPGWAFDIMSSDILDFGTYEVYPVNAAHSFLGQ
tara:strand:+ start:1483 stop:1779 length:297 start_codon:yes stop_codon:yes gene_type:complete